VEDGGEKRSADENKRKNQQGNTVIETRRQDKAIKTNPFDILYKHITEHQSSAEGEDEGGDK
jgi:hypothetical protein